MRAVSTWSFDRVVSSRPSSHATRVLRNEERRGGRHHRRQWNVQSRHGKSVFPSVDPYRPLTITREVIKYRNIAHVTRHSRDIINAHDNIK